LINSNNSPPSDDLTSFDCRIQMDKDTLFQIQLRHMYTGVYNDPSEYVNLSDSGCIYGFSEWGRSDYAVISVGWDWVYQPDSRDKRVEIYGFPFSNVLIAGADRFQGEEFEVLKAFVDGLDWRPRVLSTIKDAFN